MRTTLLLIPTVFICLSYAYAQQEMSYRTSYKSFAASMNELRRQGRMPKECEYVIRPTADGKGLKFVVRQGGEEIVLPENMTIQKKMYGRFHTGFTGMSKIGKESKIGDRAVGFDISFDNELAVRLKVSEAFYGYMTWSNRTRFATWQEFGLDLAECMTKKTRLDRYPRGAASRTNELLRANEVEEEMAAYTQADRDELRRLHLKDAFGDAASLVLPQLRESTSLLNQDILFLGSAKNHTDSRDFKAIEAWVDERAKIPPISEAEFIKKEIR